MDPGMSSAMLSIITLEVDGDTEENVAAVKDAQAGDLIIFVDLWPFSFFFHQNVSGNFNLSSRKVDMNE